MMDRYVIFQDIKHMCLQHLVQSRFCILPKSGRIVAEVFIVSLGTVLVKC